MDVLGLDEGIGIALAGDPKRFCHLPALHGEMLGENWARRLMMRKICALVYASSGNETTIFRRLLSLRTAVDRSEVGDFFFSDRVKE